jgi:uncharacterized protein (DUF58 family)
MQDYLKYLDPQVLNKITRLDLKARLIVEGYIAGMHQSPYRGVSVEFAAHREYVPGDDLRHLDWKVFGRSDRLYVKQYHQETNLICYILFDTSESMAYGSTDVSKLEYAKYIAASLSYLMVQQQDAVGLVLFDEAIREIIPPYSSQGHLQTILQQLAKVNAGKRTDFKTVSDYITQKLERKGLVIIISDLLDESHNILEGLNKLKARSQDIIVFHILDDYEINFPFEKLSRFKGLEDLPEMTVDPISLKQGYLNTVQGFISAIRNSCQTKQIDYSLIATNQKLDVVLSAYLSRRSARYVR